MKFKVGIAQINPTLGNLERNVGIYRRTIADAQAKGVNLLVFPELSLTGYFLRDMVPEVAQRLDSPVMTELAALSRQVSLVVGFVEETDDYRFYNSAAYLEDGQVKHVHRKVYLPMYGMFDEQRYFASGDKVRAFGTKFGRMGILICEDCWHLACGYVLANDGADCIVAISSSPGRGATPSHAPKLKTAETWERLNRICASFYTTFIFYANRVGYEDGINFWGGSEVVAPSGETVVKGDYLTESLVTADVDSNLVRLERVSSPLLRDEDIYLTIAELKRIRDERFRNQY